MKKLGTFLLLVFIATFSFGQVEIVSPISQLPLGKKKMILKASNPIDSTFIYNIDTISLPVFDEFSKSKFQRYEAQISDPNVTETTYYKLLNTSNVPLPLNVQYTDQETYKIEVTTGVSDTIPFPATTIKIGDFNSFPVVYSNVQVYPPYIIRDTLGFVNPPDTTFILPEYVQDSAVIFVVDVNEPDKIWVDKFAYHNYTFASTPWSLGVASFDGLDETGFPYNISTTLTGVCDYLTSKPIDLSANFPGDSIYFSCLVQPKGFGDEPEVGDSLVLEFYDAALDDWNHIWAIGGSPLTDFKKVHIRLTQAAYFTDGFRFRFKNIGGRSGMLDQFHIDYVNLRTLSGVQDTLFKDFAIVYPFGSLLKDYTQVPWDHYKANSSGKMNDEFVAVVRNGSNISENNQDGNVRVEYNGSLEGNFTMIAQDLSGGNINYAPRTAYESIHNFSGGYQYDPTKLGDEATFEIIGAASAQFPNFIQNDSCFSQQHFGNVYAYDDGSAEAAYGTNQVQARLAYKFTPYQADSLIGVQMRWVPSVIDVSSDLFLLSVWGDNGGIPGSVLYEDEFFFPRSPIYEDSMNSFTNYYLADTLKLPITGTFYVGWRQIDARPLNIGLDWNTPNADKIFYSFNAGSTWTNSSFAASLMIRPIFSTEDNKDLSIPTPTESIAWEVFPNPTNGAVSLKWNRENVFTGATCFDAQGRIVGIIPAESQDLQLDLSNSPAGIYFMHLNGTSSVKKVVRF